MSTNLFVGNLSFRTTEDELKSLFSSHGEVTSVRIVKDRDSGLSRGFGFVEMSDAGEAQSALEQLNGQELSGRAIRVDQAQARENNRGEGNRFGNRGGNRPDNRRNTRSRY